MKLEWEQVNKWHLASNPIGFTISYASMLDGWRMTAWHGNEHLLTTKGPNALAECKAACELARLEVEAP